MHQAFGTHEQALIDAERALDLDASCMPAYLVRAKSYVNRGQPEKALADFSRAQELAPFFGHLYKNRGDLLVTLGDDAGALADFNRAVEIMPGDPFVRKRRASALFRLGRYDEALANLKYAIQRNPKDTSTLVQIPPASVARCKDESFKSGMMALADQLVENSEQKGSVLVARSLLLVALGDRERALRDMDQATVEFSQTTPSFDECYQRYSAALLCLQLGDNEKYRESLHAMQQRFATTEDPKSQNFVGWTACLVPDSVEDYSTVLALAEQAVTADPENDQYQKTLAGLRFRAGEHDAARELLIEIVQRDDNPDAKANSSPAYGWYFLAMTQQALGNTEEAKTLLAKANDWTSGILSDEKSPPAWNRKVTLELLRDEATEVISHAVNDQPIGVEATSDAAK